ncbi:GNAT family N-acetyltransferase [Pseudomonas sp. IT-232MI5]|jgi:RimJ/RimL family protein N-acetyltransferase|uniref:GNAT family N-acetyltransferase n=1 Tax=unclassified Pseudomonas TaxID=196821 RepID=UPI00211402FA|nr:GNAT family N-acetyltransferase [Pseudomonas sp. Irchel 3H7]
MPAGDFDCQPALYGSTLKLRALIASDFETLFLAASDPLIWTGHPASDRYERQVFEAYFAARLATRKALAVIDIETAQIVGMSSYYIPPDQPESIAIGYTFLVREKWGGDANRELKRLMLEHAFKVYDTVYFHIGPANLRSQKALLKIGAGHLYDAELNLSGAPALCKCYGLSRAQWLANPKAQQHCVHVP